jgi:hypothetical protein
MVQLAAQPPRRVDLENLAIAVIQTKGIAWAPKRYRAMMTSSAVSLLHISDRFWDLAQHMRPVDNRLDCTFARLAR